MRFVVIRMLDSGIGIFEKLRTHEIVSSKCKWLRACQESIAVGPRSGVLLTQRSIR